MHRRFYVVCDMCIICIYVYVCIYVYISCLVFILPLRYSVWFLMNKLCIVPDTCIHIYRYMDIQCNAESSKEKLYIAKKNNRNMNIQY